MKANLISFFVFTTIALAASGCTPNEILISNGYVGDWSYEKIDGIRQTISIDRDKKFTRTFRIPTGEVGKKSGKWQLILGESPFALTVEDPGSDQVAQELWESVNGDILCITQYRTSKDGVIRRRVYAKKISKFRTEEVPSESFFEQ